MGKWIIAASAVFAWCGQAPARSALVAAGHCENAELLDWSKQLAALLRDREELSLVDGEEVLKRLPAATPRPASELERQLEAAARLYFQGGHASADQRVVDALADVQQLKPGPTRWRLYARGLLLRALILRARNLPAEAAEQFRRVLRVDPSHRLDADYFPPTAREDFNRLRRKLRSQPKRTLALTSTPSGAAIFVDGLDLQRSTPATLELVAGRYSVSVSKGDRSSFSRFVDLPASSSLHLDLEFEGAVTPGLVPCLRDEEEELRVRNAAKLGRWLGVDRILLIAARDNVLRGDVIQVDTEKRLREAEVSASHPARRSALAELAELLAADKSDGRPRAEQLASSPAAEPSVGEEPAEERLALAVRRPPAEEPSRRGSSDSSAKTWATVLGSTLIGAGSIAAGGAAVFQIRSDRARADLDHRYANGTLPPLSDLNELQSLSRQAQWQRRAAFAGYALGAAAVCTGVLFLLTSAATPARSPARTAIRASPGELVLEGTWN